MKHQNSENEHDVIQLDEIDKKILEVLQQDGKASLRGIAEKISNGYPGSKPSVTQIKNHLNFLEENGVIKHYSAIVDCCKVGYNEMLIFTLRINTSVSIDDIFEELEEIEDINAIYQTSGVYPIMCMAKCVSKEHQIRLLERVKSITGVDECITEVVMRRVKEDFRVKIPDEQIIPKKVSTVTP